MPCVSFGEHQDSGGKVEIRPYLFCDNSLDNITYRVHGVWVNSYLRKLPSREAGGECPEAQQPFFNTTPNTTSVREDKRKHIAVAIKRRTALQTSRRKLRWPIFDDFDSDASQENSSGLSDTYLCSCLFSVIEPVPAVSLAKYSSAYVWSIVREIFPSFCFSSPAR